MVTADQPQVLLLASRYDVTCDYVVSRLRSKSVRYLRLNSEDLSDTKVEFEPTQRTLRINLSGDSYLVTPFHLRSVLFRRPVYLREYGNAELSPAQRFSKVQWASFMRNLMTFHEPRWFNFPVATYRAEHKAMQLHTAAKLGFAVPETRITNTPYPGMLRNDTQYVAMKGLDTILLRDGGYELFGFTSLESSENLEPSGWRSAPAIIQEGLTNKLDIRVTVVEDKVFAARIEKDGKQIAGDWRVKKGDVRFSAYDLPSHLKGLCCQLLRDFGLNFGAIDLALSEGEYYFLELNPTGEWAWLVDSAGLPIDEAVAEALAQG